LSGLSGFILVLKPLESASYYTILHLNDLTVKKFL